MKYLLVLLLLALAAVHASADINFGAYARTIGMGGAGLAVIDDVLASGITNPAAYALKSPGFRLMLPSVDFRIEGASLSDLIDAAGDTTDTSENAVELARELGKQNTKVDLGIVTGLSIGPMVITADGQAQVILEPGEGYRNWAITGQVSNPADYQDEYIAGGISAVNDAIIADGYTADVTGYAVASLPAIAFGMKLPGNPQWNLGIRVKALRSKAVHELVVPEIDENDITVEGSQITAINLGSAFTTRESESLEIDDSGIGADLGFIYQAPRHKSGLAVALVFTNFFKPSLSQVNIERMVSVGAALRPNSKLMLAADLININRAYDENVKLRLGAELTPLRWLALRAGYGDGNFTFGLGLMGMNIAFSQDSPLVVGRAWSF